MYLNRFQQGDKVQYCGRNEHLAKELSGKLGIVHARVGGEESGVVVDFGSDSYIMDERTALTRFQGKERAEGVGDEAHTKGDKKGDKKSPAGPEVTRRKPRRTAENG